MRPTLDDQLFMTGVGSEPLLHLRMAQWLTNS
jgi:hypothetical protein